MIDNVICVHNIDATVALLFDVRCDPKGVLTAPLPVAPLPEMKAKDDDHSRSPKRVMTIEGVTGHFYENWTFVLPHLILDSKTPKEGVLWELELDLHEIARTWRGDKQEKLVDFLLKREDPKAKEIVLEMSLNMINEDTPISMISRIFNMLNRVLYDDMVYREQHSNSDAAHARVASGGSASNNSMMSFGTPTRSDRGSGVAGVRSPTLNKNTKDEEKLESGGILAPAVPARRTNHLGYTIVSQDDMHNLVFLAARPKVKAISTLIAAVTEYIRSTYRFYLEPESNINELLVELLVEDGQIYEMRQHLQYHILQDSKKIAEKLLSLSDKHPPAYQLALDMLFRLNDVTTLLRVLLEKGEVLTALRLVRPKSRIFREEGLQPKDFLETALTSNNANIFYATYQFFESRNLALRMSPVFIPEENCEKFVIHYNHLFGKMNSISLPSNSYVSSEHTAAAAAASTSK